LVPHLGISVHSSRVQPLMQLLIRSNEGTQSATGRLYSIVSYRS